MQNPIKALQNEMVCQYRQANGCDHNCRKCNFGLEDPEIIATYEAAIEALKFRMPKSVEYNKYDRCYCPHCTESLEEVEGLPSYCPYCGQALIW